MGDGLDFNCEGLCIRSEPGWTELESEAVEGFGRLLLESDDGGGVLQFSMVTRPDPQGVTLSDLRASLKDMAKTAKLGKPSDAEESSGDYLMCAASFQIKRGFQRLWYWSDKTYTAMIVFGSDETPTAEHLRDCERMVARLRVER